MFQTCNSTIRIVLVVVTAFVMAGCSEKSRNPLSPNIAGPIEGVVISAPTRTATVGDQLVRTNDQPVTLTFATATSNSERSFWYEVEIATDQEFVGIVHTSGQIEPTSAAVTPTTRSAQNTDSAAGTQTYVVRETLIADRMYYWHVRAADGANAGPFSETAQFEIFTPVTIQAPLTVSPTDGEVVSTLRPVLKAQSAEITGPATNIKYRFEVATDSAFTDPVAVVTVAPGNQKPSASPGNLTWNTRYRWRVRASGSGREGRVDGPWSATRSFKTPELPIGTPTPFSPINGTTTASNRPTLVIQNGAVSSSAGAVTLYIQISRNASFGNLVAVFDVPQSAGPRTSVAVPAPLASDKLHYWRVRASDGVFNTGFGSPATFRTPEPSQAPSPTPSPTPGPTPEPGCCPPPNRLEVVKQVAAETGYPNSGINVSDFTQRVASRLAREDSRWGRYINNNGNLGKDTVSYRVNGNTNPFKIDIVSGAGTSHPKPHWDAHGQGGGVWKPVN